MNIELLMHDINEVGERGGDCDEEGNVMVPRWSPLEESAPNNNRWLNRGLNWVVKDRRLLSCGG
ncbi:hypothetical protein PVK06_029795 [Gossypium arboreum]|uniref:Uncharacterized protein n=1 Tax=Gossypium arboreum TaxID=29729 RepID=A0ABR0NMN6_GOSAR|nr:hypothetical protein PVK06_029795 [Gossypium arboreum]